MLPGPTNVPPRVMRAMMKPLIGHRGPEFKELYHRTLDQTKKVFETKGDLVILTSSGTGATECALQNVTDDGDEIIVTVNGFFSERLSEAIKSYGGKPVVVGADWGKAPRIEQLERAIKEHPKAKALAFVYNETSTGVTVRCLQQLGELCANHDILLMVDAISILGGDNLPVDDWNVDLCVTASQKCLMCPPGLSFVSVSEKAWEKIQTRKAKRSYYFDLLMYKKYLEEGLKQRYNRHRVCAEAIYNGTEAMGLGALAEKDSRSYTVAAIRSPQGIEESKIRELIKSKYGIDFGGSLGQVKGKIFRVGVMGSVGAPEIMTTVGAIASATAELGFKPKIDEGLAAARETLSRLPSQLDKE